MMCVWYTMYGPIERTLIHARWYVDYGWCQTFFRRRMSSEHLGQEHCLTGAVGTAVFNNDPWRNYKACNELYHKTLSFLEDGFLNREVREWNDDPSRTKQDVLQALDEAIALAKQGQV